MKSSVSLALAGTFLTLSQAAPAPGGPQWLPTASWGSFPKSWPTPSWAKPCYTATATTPISATSSAAGSVTTTATSASGVSSASGSGSASASATTSGSGSSSAAAAAPSAVIKNGTVVGVHSSGYSQDFFLGIPYAQPPIGELRFKNPQSINSSFGTFSATQYSDACVGYGSDQWPYNISEDCLYMNIIRPDNYTAYNEPLPVALWLHGGGDFMGSGIDRRYNLSFIVQNGVEIDKPFIGVSINYRLSAWGFLSSDQVLGAGQTNIGLRDQRLALHWLQENVAAFGGDPSQVTIWGESAGALDVGLHLIAYNGRNDSIISRGIMESGNSVPYNGLRGSDYYQPKYDALVANVNCSQAIDTLDCLRSVPFDTLNTAINTTNATLWYPYVDGDFIARYPSIQLSQGDFLHVPIIDGANSDEGVSFDSMPGINTTAQFIAAVQSGFTATSLPLQLATELVNTYLTYNICTLPPLTLGCSPALPSEGSLYRWVAAYAGDAVFIGNRRLQCETWAGAGLPAYCYRFNAQPYGNTIYSGVPHFQEVAFVFDNENGVGYPPIAPDPFTGKPENFFDLARLMSKSWASFINSGDPNGWLGRPAGTPNWPEYGVGDAAMNIVWDANVTGLAYPEPDTWRSEGIALINAASIAYQR